MKQQLLTTAATLGLLTPAVFSAEVNVLTDLLSGNSGNLDGIEAATDYDGAGDLPAGVMVWTADNEYILDEPVFVEAGAKLIIEPGTKIYSTYNDNGADSDPLNNDDADKTNDDFGALVVARGGTLIAEGTCDKPIVFTTIFERDGLDTNGDGSGDGVVFPVAGENMSLWGGLVLLGNAPVTKYSGGSNTGIGSVEGFAPGSDSRVLYGADLGNSEVFDPYDSSGVMKYVSIRFGGYEFAPGEEVNGLTMGGVGRGTCIEHIEVVSNSDDGFEWFGGTVDTKYLAAIMCDDDSFDFDQGHQGTHQFWFALQTDLGANGSADKAGEHDGRINAAANDFPSERTLPIVMNATYIGQNSTATGTAFKLREDFAGQYHNALFMDFGTGIDLGTGGDTPALSQARVNNGFLRFENSSWFNVPIGAKNSYLEEFALYLGDYDGDFGSANGSNQVLGSSPLAGVSRVIGSGNLDPTLGSDSLLWGYNGASLTAAADIDESQGTYRQAASITDVAHQGAFGAENWLSGWSYLEESGTLAAPAAETPLVSRPRVNVLTDLLSGNVGNTDGIEAATDYDGGGPLPAGVMVWTADNTYVLDEPVFVEDGATLIIEPGTYVVSTYNDNGADSDPLNNDDADKTNDDFGALVVARGGTLLAEGTCERPIVFTTIFELDGLDTDGDGSGDGVVFPVAGENMSLWGGLVLLGNAPVTKYSGGSNTGIGSVEGFAPGSDSRVLYGADLGNSESFDPFDSSGVMKYVSIRFGGYEFAPGEEVNGLTMGGVGRGTCIEHIEVVSNSDDGFEWFGGTVDTKYLAAIMCDDDSFDFDQGHQGTHQFWFVIQTDLGANGGADKAGEHDGRINAAANDFPSERTLPIVMNATYIGQNSTATGTAFKLREDFAGQYHNALFMDFGTGIDLGTGGDTPALSQARVNNGFLRFENSSWFNVPIGAKNSYLEEFALYLGDYDGDFGSANGSNQVLGSSPLMSVSRVVGSGSLDPTLGVDSALWSYNGATLTAASDIDGSQGTYRNLAAICNPCHQGAFGMSNWLAGWSYSSTSNLMPGAIATDTDGDGLTDAEEGTLGTNPALYDTDGDGVSDGFEAANAAKGFDPLVNDATAVLSALSSTQELLDIGYFANTIDGGGSTLTLELEGSTTLGDWTYEQDVNVPLPSGTKFYRFTDGN